MLERICFAQPSSSSDFVGVQTKIRLRLGVSPTDDPGRIAAAVELALESLYLRRKLAKDSDEGTTVYGP